MEGSEGGPGSRTPGPAAALPHCTLPSLATPSPAFLCSRCLNRASWACGHVAGSHGPLPWVLQGQVTAQTQGWALLGSLAVT